MAEAMQLTYISHLVFRDTQLILILSCIEAKCSLVKSRKNSLKFLSKTHYTYTSCICNKLGIFKMTYKYLLH